MHQTEAPPPATSTSNGAQEATDFLASLWNRLDVQVSAALCVIFFVLVVGNAALRFLCYSCQYKQRGKEAVKKELSEENDADFFASDGEERARRFANFQRRFIFIHLVGFCLDTAAGAYVEKLYTEMHALSAGRVRRFVRIAFVSGAIASCVVSPIVEYGLGRRTGMALCMWLYAARYALVSFFSGEAVLVLSQICYGIGMSLLFTVPDAWMVDQHKALQFPEGWLQDTYTVATIATSLGAVATSYLTTLLRPQLGYVWFFGGLAAACLAHSVAVFFLWEENPASIVRPPHARKPEAGLWGALAEPVRLFFATAYRCVSHFQLLAIGIGQAMFDSAVWVFITVWTPLTSGLPFESVFASFMVACALGSYAASIGTNTVDEEKKTEPQNARAAAAEGEDPFTLTLNVGDRAAENLIKKKPAGNRGSSSAADAFTPCLSPASTEWIAAASPPAPTSPSAQPAVWGSVYALRHYAREIRTKGVPLRFSVVCYQALGVAAAWLICGSTSLHNTYIWCVVFEMCMGWHYTAFVNLRAQVVPSEGRVIALCLFTVPSCLLDSVVFMLTEHWPAPKMMGVAGVYLSVMLLVTLMAWLLRGVARGKPELIVEDPEEKRKSAARSARALTAATLFFQHDVEPADYDGEKAVLLPHAHPTVHLL